MLTRSFLRNRFHRMAVLLAIVLSGFSEVGAEGVGADEPPKIVPVDQSPGHPGFHQFWRKFQRAVEDRDGKFVLSVILDDITLDFGGGAGRKEFISRWKPEDRDGPLWKELDQILGLGGTLEVGEGFGFTAPYAFGSWPEKYDAFEHVFVNGANVRFRAEPSGEGKVLRSVSWEIMKTEWKEGDEEGDWVRLKAHDGQVGFVHKDYVRSSIDYRIGFSESGKGGFTLDFFLAGD